jgi:hypothetical protein
MKKSDDMQTVRGEPIFKELDQLQDLTIDRLHGRRTLLQQLDDQLRPAEAQSAPPGFAGKRRLAFDMLTSARVREAFELKREPDSLRERYGRSLFGSSTLLARRLLERGVRFVNVTWDLFRERYEFPPTQQIWDTHQRNFPVLRANLLPNLDQTCSALMEDLDRSGLLDETLIVLMGEMGRTPRLNKDGGRDHWTSCYSVLLAGAGLQGGSVYGASDAHAAYIKDRPVHVRDVCATVYHCLGIDPAMPVYDHGRRPVPVAHGGQALEEILA